jgi:Zn-dependent M28 family amino/carboxypeptidase
MPGVSYQGGKPELTPALEEVENRLSDHVRVLSHDIGERHALFPAKLESAASYIEAQFSSMGYVPRSEVVNNRDHRNIIVDKYGTTDRNKILILGAHYDSVILSPGADDNASGVASLLELARQHVDASLPFTLRFVAFVNEERPFFGSDDMGSLHHARRAKERNEEVIGMYSLEMVGYYKHEDNSQWYPPIVRNFYPHKANYIAFIGNLMSREFLHHSISSFRGKASIPSQGLVAPQFLVPDIRRSDHAPFWFHGIPAIMITDTANFRNKNYHRNSDRAETLDYESMALLVEGITYMLPTIVTATAE